MQCLVESNAANSVYVFDLFFGRLAVTILFHLFYFIFIVVVKNISIKGLLVRQ